MLEDIKKTFTRRSSAADQWTVCAGSLAMQALMPPEPTSPHAAQGTAAHALAAQCLVENKDANELFGVTIEGYEVTQEMAEAVQVYLNYVRKQVKELGLKMAVEYRLDLNTILASPGVPDPDCGGTTDVMLWNDHYLEVVDYKHGEGTFVEANENKQLLLYLIGADQATKHPERDVFRTTVIQPRYKRHGEPIRSREYCRDDLYREPSDSARPGWIPWFRDRIADTFKPDAPLHASEKGCRWCTAKGVCPEIANMSLQKAQLVFGPKPVADLAPEQIHQSIDENARKDREKLLSMDQITTILDNLSMIQGWIKAVEKHATEQARAGTEIPGYKLVAKGTHRRWIGDLDKVKTWLGGKLRQQQYLNFNLLSPAQVETQLKSKNLSKRAMKNFEALVEKPPGDLILAPESDKRPAVRMRPEDVFQVTEKADAPAEPATSPTPAETVPAAATTPAAEKGSGTIAGLPGERVLPDHNLPPRERSTASSPEQEQPDPESIDWGF